MPVPKHPISALQRLVRCGLAFLLLGTTTGFVRGPEPAVRIPLDSFGFQPVAAQFLLSGSSMFTLHYVDDKHLLVTFVVHRLIPRLPDEPEGDQDRVTDAVLLELPTGKVLARTTWHLHDHAQYLWNLGHGHFLLRVRDTLTTFAPLANLSSGQPFAERPFLATTDRRLAALILSPEKDLLIVETLKRMPPESKPDPNASFLGPLTSPRLTERNLVQINFYRIHPRDDGGPIERIFAGIVQSRTVGDVPATTAGYLAVVDQGRQHWAFDFHTYGGKTNELSPFDSTCAPAPIFVSHSEFIAFGCRNSHNRQQIGGFNMRGEEMWEQGLFGDYVSPSMAFAPASGRFALSRVILRTSAVADQPISADEVSTQAVVVYQTSTGRQLLKVDCSPVQRAGQNFALSPDGMALAVIHGDAIEIHELPPLTSKEAEALKLAQAAAPPESDLPIHFTNSPPPSSTAAAPQAAPPPPLPPTPPPAAAPAVVPSENANQPALFSQPDDPSLTAAQPKSTTPAPTQTSGDAPPEQHRAPPTLYNQPSDKPPANPKDTPQ